MFQSGFPIRTPDQFSRLKAFIFSNFLFFLPICDQQSGLVLGALVEKRIPAKDIKVITQGDAVDYSYVIE